MGGREKLRDVTQERSVPAVAGKKDPRLKYKRTTVSITATLEYKIIGCGTNTGAITITLPSAAVAAGHPYIIKDEDGNAETNNITVASEGSETIDGGATDTIGADYDRKGYYSDGTNWFII